MILFLMMTVERVFQQVNGIDIFVSFSQILFGDDRVDLFPLAIRQIQLLNDFVNFYGAFVMPTHKEINIRQRIDQRGLQLESFRMTFQHFFINLRDCRIIAAHEVEAGAGGR